MSDNQQSLEMYYQQIESEQSWEEYMGIISRSFEGLKTVIESANSDIMWKAEEMDFQQLIESGSFKLPKHRNGKSQQLDNIGNISEPIEQEWLVMYSRKEQLANEKQQLYLEANKKKIARELAQKQLKEKIKRNKHNWTLPKDTPKPKPKQQIRPTVSKKRKNRRKRFTINKSCPSKM